MSTKDYGYRGMMVEYWDLLRGDTSKWSSSLSERAKRQSREESDKLPR